MDISNSKTIYFIRHAKDDSRYRGGWSKRPLVRDGDIQACKLSENIIMHNNTMNIHTIISSDLPRAIQTARPLSQSLKIQIKTDASWRETNNGKLAGMLSREAERRYPGMYWSKLEPDQRYPGGESPKEFYNRISTAFTEIKNNVEKSTINSNVAVFTHSGVINIIYSIVNNKEWTNKTKSFDIPYTSIHAFDIQKNTILQIM